MDKITGMRTYQFTFTRPDTNKQDTTQFCANTQSDAYELFKDFIIFDEKLDFNNISDIECEEVYNPDDAEEYGSYYATTK